MADEKEDTVVESQENAEEDSSEESEDVPDQHDIEALRAAQDEARAVLDHQIQNFTDVDDKAMKTARLDAILLGLIITSVSFVVRAERVSIDPYINFATIISVIALIGSFIAAIITYTSSMRNPAN